MERRGEHKLTARILSIAIASRRLFTCRKMEVEA